MVELKDVGKRVKCPKCGREGRVRVLRQRTRKVLRGGEKEYEYYYLIVRHPDGDYCVISRIDKLPERRDEVVRMLSELEELRRRVEELRGKLEETREEELRLEAEKRNIEGQLSFYRDVWARSLPVETPEEATTRIRELMEKGYKIRILPYREVLTTKYGL